MTVAPTILSWPLSPRGRGREAMTYGRVADTCAGCGASRRGRKSSGRTGEGRLLANTKAPSSGPSDHLLPKGRRAAAAPLEFKKQ